MPRLVFDGASESTPFDLDGVLTEWRLVGSTSYPTAETGLRWFARTFDGTSGYEATDEDSALLGLRSMAWRLLLRPDFDALAGTSVTLISRGRGGATAGEYWAWDLRLAVNAGATQGTLSLAWQDESGAVVEHDLGTFDRPPSGSWTVLGATREPVASGTYLRLSVDGVAQAEVTVDDQIPATPGEVVTLGCRRNGAGYDRFYTGDMGLAVVATEAATPLQERQEWRALVEIPDEDREALRGYWPDTDILSTRDSNYDSYRLRPLSELVASTSEAIEERTIAGLPDTAYGARLRQWEGALGLAQSGRLSVSERQARATAAMALVQGISRTFLESYACGILGASTALEAVATVARLAPAYLWAGTATDAVAGAELTSAGSADQGTDDVLPLSTPWGRGALTLTQGSTDTWSTSDATIADMDNTQAVAVLVAFYVDTFPAATSTLLGKRDEASSSVGWELALDASGNLLATIDSGGAPVTLTLSSLHSSPGWHVAIVRHDPDTGLWECATEMQEDSAAFASSASSTVALALGAYRTPDTPAWRCNLVGVIEGEQAAALDLRSTANKVFDALSLFDPVVEFRRALVLDPSILCLGQPLDVVTETELTPAGTAASTVISDVSGAFGRGAYDFDGSGEAVYSFEDASLGGIPAADSRAYFVILRARTLPGNAVFGKQDGTSEGFNIFFQLGVGYRLTTVTDSTVLASMDLTSTSSTTDEWRCLCCVFDRTNGEVRFASDLEPSPPIALPAERINPPSDPLRIGDSRTPPSSLNSPDAEIALVAEVQDDVPDIDPQTAAAALLAWFLGI